MGSVESFPWYFWVLLAMGVLSFGHIAWFVFFENYNTYNKRTPIHCSIILASIGFMIICSAAVILYSIYYL